MSTKMKRITATEITMKEREGLMRQIKSSGMESSKLDILLEHLNLDCKYHVEDGGTFCERAWANTERGVLKYVYCKGHVLKCELRVGDVLRRVA